MRPWKIIPQHFLLQISSLHEHQKFHSPLGVAVLDNVKLALSKGVPELDGSVSGGRDNLTVVSRERDAALPHQRSSSKCSRSSKNSRENVASVADKLLGCQTSVKVPQPKGVVPRGRKSKLAVGRDGNIGHEVVVTVEDFLGETVQVVLSGELPSNDSLVYENPRQLFLSSKFPADGSTNP